MIKDFVKKTQNNKINVLKHTEKVLREAEKINKEYHYLNIISKESALKQARELNRLDEKERTSRRLFGVPVSVKDCICVKGMESRAGSRILEGYKPLFDATVVAKLKKEGAIIIGKTSQDEFGFGSFNTNVGLNFKIPKNPFDKERVCGGSSGGSAGLVQKMDWPSLGESTGGSIVNPASFCGVIGLCPTYGRVSRYGMIDYGNSLDKIGPITQSIDDAALLLEIISGFDEKTSTTVDKKFVFRKDSFKGMKIALLKEGFGRGTDKVVADRIKEYAVKLKKQGAEISEIGLPLTQKYGIAAYYIIALSEASTNLAKYCGIRYGKTNKLSGGFNDYFTKIRSEYLGREAKRRIILGTFARMAGYRDAYYIKASKVRTKIIEEYKNVFKKYDLILSPAMPVLPPKFDDIKRLTPLQNYMMDVLTVGPNLAGLPHISIPVGSEKRLPVGAMFVADHFEENKLLQLDRELKWR